MNRLPLMVGLGVAALFLGALAGCGGGGGGDGGDGAVASTGMGVGSGGGAGEPPPPVASDEVPASAAASSAAFTAFVRSSLAPHEDTEPLGLSVLANAQAPSDDTADPAEVG